MKIVKPAVELWAPFNNLAPMEHIERCARLCYKSEGQIKEGSAEKLLTRLMGVRHFSIIEHYRFIVEVPEDVYSDLLIFHPRFLILSDYHKRFLVSGSARGFLELLEYADWVTHDAKLNDEVGTLERVCAPTLYWGLLGIIDTIVKEYHCPTLFSGYASFVKPWDGVSIVRQEDLTGLELIQHGWFTAHIICDRGISHEWVRHRDASPSQESTRYCNYSGDKFGNEISVVQPVDVATTDQTRIWSNGIKSDEITYFDLLDAGAKPQTARANLPTCLKTELAFTATHEEWRHLLGLRCGKEAHPDARVIALKVLKQAHAAVPHVYEDLWAQWGGEVDDRGL